MPPTEFARLAKPPLVFVLAQVVVNPVENLRKYISEIQDRLRKMSFIEFQAISAPQFVLESGKITMKSANLWNFMTRDKRTAVIVSPDMVVVQTSAYDRFEPFSSLVIEILKQVDEGVEHYQVRRRLGLRYVDQLASNEAGAPAVDELLDPGLLGMRSVPNSSGPAFRRIESTYTMEAGQLSVRFSDIPNQPLLPVGIEPFDMIVPRKLDEGTTPVLLDIDRYQDIEQDFDLEKIRADLASFHVDVERAFRSAVTPRALRYWEEEGS